MQNIFVTRVFNLKGHNKMLNICSPKANIQIVTAHHLHFHSIGIPQKEHKVNYNHAVLCMSKCHAGQLKYNPHYLMDFTVSTILHPKYCNKTGIYISLTDMTC